MLIVMFGLPSPVASQTIGGRLLDAQTGQPIDLGVLVLITADGDSVAMTATRPDGRFSLTAPEPGDYRLYATALGYAEREEGVFELGPGGRLDIEFRISSRPIELEEILVSTDRPTASHPLVQSGFVDRHRRGMGHFITPRDLERTVYRDTESLFHFIPGVRVVATSVSSPGGASLELSSDQVMMRNAWGPCVPTVYVDGVRTPYQPDTGETLSEMLLVDQIEAVEVYSRAAQAPPRFGGATANDCGLIVFWTK